MNSEITFYYTFKDQSWELSAKGELLLPEPEIGITDCDVRDLEVEIPPELATQLSTQQIVAIEDMAVDRMIEKFSEGRGGEYESE